MTRTISNVQCIARKNGDELHLHFPRHVLSAERGAPERVISLLAPYGFEHRGNRSAIASCAQSALASRIDIITNEELMLIWRKFSMARYTVAGIGEVLWDVFPGGKQLGGAIANAAYHADALGAQGVVISRVGDDELGHEIKNLLQQLGLRTDTLQTDPEHPTSTVDVTVNSEGQPAYNIHEKVAWDYIKYTDSLQGLQDVLHAVFFGTLASRNTVSQRSISRFLDSLNHECLRVFDINLRQSYYSHNTLQALLKRADVLKFNDEELNVFKKMFNLTGDINQQLAQLIMRFDIQTIALTQGSKGSLLLNAEGQDFCPPDESHEIRDTVGAGDSFCAALALGLLENMQLSDINRYANQIASYVCSCNGATPAIPKHLKEPFSAVANENYT